MIDDPPVSCRLNSTQHICFLKFTSTIQYLFWGCTPCTGYGLIGVEHQCTADGTSSGWDRCLTLLDDTQNKGTHSFNSPLRHAARVNGRFTAKPLAKVFWHGVAPGSSLCLHPLPAAERWLRRHCSQLLIRRGWDALGFRGAESQVNPVPALQPMAGRCLSGTRLISNNKPYTAVHWPCQKYTKPPAINLRSSLAKGLSLLAILIYHVLGVTNYICSRRKGFVNSRKYNASSNRTYVYP